MGFSIPYNRASPPKARLFRETGAHFNDFGTLVEREQVPLALVANRKRPVESGLGIEILAS